MKQYITTNNLLWLVYLALLGVLLPHTAWAFGKFEPAEGVFVAWAAAFAFEAAIAVLTHKLAKHIESTPRRVAGWAKFAYRYVNAYSVGLMLSLGVSVLANLAHAVEFGGGIKIFTDWGVPSPVYAVAFGAVLPVTSLLFARVLSNVVESEEQADPEMEQARVTITELRRKLTESERQRTAAEQQAKQAEARFAAAGDLFARLFAEEKRVKILAARETWPTLTPAAIAVIATCSTSYVSEVLGGRSRI